MALEKRLEITNMQSPSAATGKRLLPLITL